MTRHPRWFIAAQAILWTIGTICWLLAGTSPVTSALYAALAGAWTAIAFLSGDNR